MVYLVTGGTGTLGQKLVRKLLDHWQPEAVRIYSRGEYPQWQMAQQFKDERLRFLIGDVRDKDRLSRAMNGADRVFHCAALKHVNICAFNPMEAVKTNILGAMNVIDCCVDNDVKRCLAVSSDKAVEPINIYGATKLAEEHLFRHAGVYGKTLFGVIRPPNFTESRGNFTENWRAQSATGAITVTDVRMRRFFLPAGIVAEMMLQFIEDMTGGEVFVPKCDEQNILDLAEALHPNCRIETTGIRPGERLREALLYEGEVAEEHEDYWVVR